MGLISDFKKFAVKGNVIDMAVGVVVGGAFTSIVNSLVKDIIMPPIAAATGDIKFDEIVINLKEATLDAEGNVVKEAVTMNIGSFIQTVVYFFIVAISIFLIVRGINKAKDKMEEKQKAEAAAAAAAAEAEAKKKAEEEAKLHPSQEALLAEIRDLLKAKQ